MLRSGSAWGYGCIVVLGVALAGPVRADNAPTAAATAQPVVAPSAGQAPASTQPAGSQPAGAPKLRIDQPTYEFSELWSGEKVEHTFVLANDGDAPLQVLSVQPSCGCTVAGQFDKVIDPHKEGKVPLSVNTKNFRGLITKSIQVQTNDPASPRSQLIIKGTVKQRVSMEPMAGANWAEYNDKSPDEIKVTLTNNTDKPFKIEYVPETQPALASRLNVFEPTVTEKVPGKVAEVSVKLKKPVPEGWHGGQLKFKTGVSEDAEVFVPCNVTVVPPLQVIPAMVGATMQVGQEYKQMVTIRYTKDEPIKIVDLKAADPRISTQLVESRPGKEFQLTIVLPAGFDGTSEVAVTTDLKENPKITIPIRARQLAAASQPSLDAIVGQPAPVVTLKNVEGGDVRIGGPGGQPMVVDFFATWCPHCRKQLPVLQKVYEKFAGKVRFVSVSTDGQRKMPKVMTPQEIADFVKGLNVTIPLVLDPTGTAAPRYNATSLPTLLVVNKNGTIEAFHRGEELDPQTRVSTLDSRLEAELNVLLAGKTRADFPPRPVSKPATQPAPVVVAGPSLKLESSRVEMGLHKPGEVVRAYVSYRNLGTQPLTVDVKAAAGLKLEPDYAKQLETGAAGLARCEVSVPKAPGPFNYELTFETNDPAHKAEKVLLAGAVQGFIEFTPPNGVNFPRTPRTQSIPMMATLSYNGEGKVEYSAPESTSPKFEAKLEPLANSRYTKLTVTAKPPFALGDNTGSIRIKTDCKEQPLVEIPVRLFNPPRIELNPPEAKIQAAPALQRAMVLIQNNGDKPLAILGVKSSHESIRYQFFPEPDGLSYRVLVTVRLPENGAPLNDAKLTIRTDDPEYAEVVLPVKVENVPAGAASPSVSQVPLPLPGQNSILQARQMRAPAGQSAQPAQGAKQAAGQK